MINQKIRDKLKEKCHGDMILEKFILNLLKNEEEGKQYSKAYDKFVNQALKEYGEHEI